MANRREFSISELEAAIDEGSEEAAQTVMKYFIRELYMGRPILPSLGVRLSIALRELSKDQSLADCLSLKRAANEFARTHWEGKTSNSGRKPDPLEHHLRIYMEVRRQHQKVGRLRSRKGRGKRDGACGLVGIKLGKGESTIERNYRLAKAALDKLLQANAESARRRILLDRMEDKAS